MKKFFAIILTLALVFSCVQIPVQAAWQQKGNSWYYTDASGKPVTGWVLDGGKWYYMNSSGAMVTGWVSEGGKWYYMNSSGAMVTGWLQLGSTWYYMNASGVMVTGTVTIGGKQHKFSASGVWQGEAPAAKNGWVSEGGKWYYYKNDVKATGWQQVRNVWYYFNSQGVMQTGWVQLGSTWYYMNASGAMQTGWQTFGADTYYFYTSGAMAVSTVIDGITLGADGKVQQEQEDPDPEEPDPDDIEDPEDPPASATITIGVPLRAIVEDYDDNALTRWLEQETGYQIEFMYYMQGAADMKAQLNAQIASGESLPDIIMGCDLGGAVAGNYGQDGYLADLTPYFTDTDGAAKNFWDRMNACLTPDERAHVMRTTYSREADGIYGVPSITTDTFNTNCMAWINQEWLDALELEMPTNMDEFYAVLVAFKNEDPNGNSVKDEIPLIGAERMSGGKVTDWLINMFLYYDSNALWQPDSSGQLQPVFTQDSYRQALMFIDRLVDEGLLSNASFSMGAADIRSVMNIDPSVVGVYVGDLRALAQQGVSSDRIYQYAPIINWGYTVEKDISCKVDCFVTTDCENVAAGFKVLMTLYSQEGTLRMRFGEKGVDWTDEDVWGDAANGADANIEVLNDVTGGVSSSWWGFQASGILDNDGSAAVAVENETDEDYWLTDNLAHGAKSVIWGVYSTTPENACPTLLSDELYIAQIQVRNQVEAAQKKFVTGQLDPNDDSDWDAYLQELNTLGLENATNAARQAYDADTVCIGNDHGFANATCTEAQKCIFCGKTQGQPKGHSYGAESCSRCGGATPSLTGNRWISYNDNEGQIARPRLSFYEDGTCMISISYYDAIDAEYLDMYLYWDWAWINGKPYAQVPSGTGRDGRYTASGNTVTIEFYDGKIVMTKQSDGSYVVTSAECFVDAGTVFTAE